MRELRVEDALLYLDQVKVEFGDRPHIYNEFLEIMKTFKTQQIDTPGVIRRVSNLFKGNLRLVMGFNTFLPEGYQIELPDGGGPPVAVYRSPGSNTAQILREGEAPDIPAAVQAAQLPHNAAAQVQPSMPNHGAPSSLHQPPRGPAAPQIRHPNTSSGAVGQQQQHMQRINQSNEGYGQNTMTSGPHGLGHNSSSQQQAMMSRERSPHSLEQRQQPPAGFSPSGLHHSTGPSALQSASQANGSRDGNIVPSGGPPRMPNQLLSGAQPPMNGNGAGIARRGPQGAADPAVEPKTAQAHQPQPAANAAQGQQPMEFDHAINYVTTIKKRFASEPEIYKKFLEILHTYQKEQRGIKDVLEEVSKLFSEHPDLLKEFTFFLPDAVQAQAKAQLDQVAKEAEARKRSQAKQAIMSAAQEMKQAQNTSRSSELDRKTVHIPFGALQGRTEEQEHNVIRGAQFGVVSFDPVRPPRQSDTAPLASGQKVNRPVTIPPLPKQPNTIETLLFQRIKKHLERRELRSDRPVGSRRHTPYVEFLKCLHLYGACVINRDELLLLLKSLFTFGHAPKTGTNSSVGVATGIAADANELIREVEDIIVARGPYAEQESAIKDRSKYGCLRTCEFDFSNCENPTPSYHTYPADYPHNLFNSHPGQTKWDREALKDAVVCVGKTNGKRKRFHIEDYNAVAVRHNTYEEALLRIEDERYELDMAIERNAQALRQVEPLTEEVKALREQEEKDNQPIGRLQYRLNRNTLNSVHINAIARLYGDRGDEVLQHLVRNPLAVFPIVYQRLKQKDAEWRKVKAELTSKLNAITAANYEGSFDVQSHFKRRDLERQGLASNLRDDCVRALTYAMHPEKREEDSFPKFSPTHSCSHPDSQALLNQPYVAVKSKLDNCHRDAFQLISTCINANSSLSKLTRERIGRLLAEFVVPWFNLPPFWVADQIRTSFSGSLGPNMVKFSPGQKVETTYGEGTVIAFVKHTSGSSAKYRVKLSFGMSYLHPSSILHAIPSQDAPFVRRDGAMVRDEAIVKELTSDIHLGENYQILFGTEPIYLFLRLFVLLVSILKDTRESCEAGPPPVDPANNYLNPLKSDQVPTSSHHGLDFFSMIQDLKKVVSGQMDNKSFESLGRKISRDVVFQIAALPKYVDRCASALIKVAKEDVLLRLYDYCHHSRVDPKIVRNHCFAVAPDASYRIQYNRALGEMCFCHIPMGKTLYVTKHESTSFPADENMSDAENDESHMDDENDPIEDYEDEQPSWKKQRIS